MQRRIFTWGFSFNWGTFLRSDLVIVHQEILKILHTYHYQVGESMPFSTQTKTVCSALLLNSIIMYVRGTTCTHTYTIAKIFFDYICIYVCMHELNVFTVLFLLQEGLRMWTTRHCPNNVKGELLFVVLEKK